MEVRSQASSMGSTATQHEYALVIEQLRWAVVLLVCTELLLTGLLSHCSALCYCFRICDRGPSVRTSIEGANARHV
jgi:hypothetical protein